MKLSKFSIISVFIFFSVFSFSNYVLGAEEHIKVDQANLVATVNIKDARILSNVGNTFDIAFALSNEQGLQAGVKYGVRLVSETGKYTADEKVYEESVTLNENTSIKREITYIAPSNLSGSYRLLLVSRSENNFPFSTVLLGDVKLTATTKGIMIANDSCYLQVEGEKSAFRYTLTQNVDINSKEQLKLTCNAVNEGEEVSVSPFYETRYSGSFGKIASQTGGDYRPIKFTKGEKKTFSLLLPKGDIAQFYNVKFALMNKNIPSNNVSLGYIISGPSASVQKVSLDKDYYKRGVNGEMSILWYSSSGAFERSKSPYATMPTVSVKATITNKKGRECIKPLEQAIAQDLNNPVNKIPLEIKTTCIDPKVSVTLTDDKGNVLDQKDFSFKSNPENIKPISKTSTILIIVGLLAIIGLGIYMKKRKGVNVNVK